MLRVRSAGMDVWEMIATGAPSPRKEAIIETHPEDAPPAAPEANPRDTPAGVRRCGGLSARGTLGPVPSRPPPFRPPVPFPPSLRTML